MAFSLEQEASRIITERWNRLAYESVRLPREELKATGPGPESGFVISFGRRSTIDERLRRNYIQLMREGVSLISESVCYLRRRLTK